jgi:hypothetical protein
MTNDESQMTKKGLGWGGSCTADPGVAVQLPPEHGRAMTNDESQMTKKGRSTNDQGHAAVDYPLPVFVI